VALELNPNLAVAYCGLGDSLTYEGRIREAIPYFQKAFDISPFDPQRWAFCSYRALAHLFAGEFDQTVEWANAAIRIPNCHYWPYAHRVSALGHDGGDEEISAAVTELLQKKPDFSVDHARSRLFYVKDHAQLNLYLEGLRRAGIRER
jgi:tetratricopeptide (TPR) repeat protein